MRYIVLSRTEHSLKDEEENQKEAQNRKILGTYCLSLASFALKLGYLDTHNPLSPTDFCPPLNCLTTG